jgi:Cu-Zn family superoxide dismutase
VSRATRIASLLLVLAACGSEVRAVRPTTTAHAGVPGAHPERPAHPAQPASQVAAEAPTAASETPGASEPGAPREAIAVIKPTRGSAATGSVRFREVDGGLEVIATIENLAGRHVYNIHTRGDCSAFDASSAGPRLELAAAASGDTIAHDLGELRDEGKLTATQDTRLEAVSLSAIVGRSIVVITRSDNPYIPPGKRVDVRVGCGVIKAVR